MLKIVYAGHGIFKDKYFGVYRRDGRPLLSLEAFPPTNKEKADHQDGYQVHVRKNTICKRGDGVHQCGTCFLRYPSHVRRISSADLNRHQGTPTAISTRGHLTLDNTDNRYL